MLANRHGPRRTVTRRSKTTRFTGSQFVNKSLTRRKRRKMATKWHTCIPRSKRQTSNGQAYQYKQRNDKTVHACIPRSKRQTINVDAYLNASRQHSYVYLVLSVRQAMETLVNSSRRITKLRVHVYLVIAPHIFKSLANWLPVCRVAFC